MILAVASGKGGTGKTTVSSALVSVWNRPRIACDLDVEEPNLHLFLRPEITGTEKAGLAVPEIDESKCSKCGKCSDLCQFKAISLMGELLLTFPEMCHGCGGCMAICPEQAIGKGFRELGDTVWGQAGESAFLMGRLRVGEAMSPPLMRIVKEKLKEITAQMSREQGDGDSVSSVIPDVIIDAPPGVSCPALNAVSDSDFILLVTEPTPFGVYDLELAHEAFLPLHKPMGVVINRAGLGDNAVYEFCADKELQIMAEIPYDRGIAENYASGRIISDISPEMHRLFSGLAGKIRTACSHKTMDNLYIRAAIKGGNRV
ncbi:MAG: ATP-binding protein [Desulfococcaceae bacterium]|jgi:MinD superfamily P-loop ATPase|nr:ATP-binding protein [Desulfococcaceae bacterium]